MKYHILKPLCMIIMQCGSRHKIGVWGIEFLERVGVCRSKCLNHLSFMLYRRHYNTFILLPFSLSEPLSLSLSQHGAVAA